MWVNIFDKQIKKKRCRTAKLQNLKKKEILEE